MTAIHLYHCPTAPAGRTWIGTSPSVKGATHIVIYGATADDARAKVQLQIEYQSLGPKDRKAFDLKGKLAAMGGKVAPAFASDLL